MCLLYMECPSSIGLCGICVEFFVIYNFLMKNGVSEMKILLICGLLKLSCFRGV